MNEIKPGDIVVLKSGGPSMTVESVATQTDLIKKAKCTWFTGETKSSDTIAVVALKLVKE